MAEDRGEAPRAPEEGTESLAAKRTAKARPWRTVDGRSLRAGKLQQALARVKANKGSRGHGRDDRRAVAGVPEAALASHPGTVAGGTYKPQPVKRVEIPKPDGGVRQLGIPTVLDRFIQQAVMQVLQGRWDRTFSEHSYGFRPGRSAHQAVAQAQQYIAEGHRWVVDLDLEKFFDRVNHDKLMASSRAGRDKRMLKLIRAFLTAGVMENGLVSPVDEGTPQGGPLSPLLSNIVLDELDRELERRGLRFVRYADDCNIYVRSQRAGERVMESITRFITRSSSSRSTRRRARWRDRGSGSFWASASRRRVAEAADRAEGSGAVQAAGPGADGTDAGGEHRADGEGAGPLLTGLAGLLRVLRNALGAGALDQWIRRRLRSAIWKQWKRGTLRFAELRKRGVGKDLAAQTAGSAHGPWRLANSPALAFALPNAYFDSLGIPRLTGWPIA